MSKRIAYIVSRFPHLPETFILRAMLQLERLGWQLDLYPLIIQTQDVVPEEALIQVDVRVMQPGEWERLEAEMSTLKPVLDGTSIEITGSLNRPPMPFDETMKATFEKAKSIAAQIGMDLKAGGTGGAARPRRPTAGCRP